MKIGVNGKPRLTISAHEYGAKYYKPKGRKYAKVKYDPLPFRPQKKHPINK